MSSTPYASTRPESSSMLIGRRLTRWLPLGAVAGPLLLTLAWFVLGFISPGYTLYGTLIAPYSVISQPISGLGLGITAPFMNAAFMLCGLLQLLGVLGIFQRIREMSPLARWVCAILFALSSLGVFLDGLFTLEAGFIHYVSFMLADATAIVGFLALGLALRGTQRWHGLASGLIFGSLLTLLLTIVFFVSFNPDAAGAGLGIAGLTERLLVLALQFWFVALGWTAFRQSTHSH